jgi:hypothetical protein
MTWFRWKRECPGCKELREQLLTVIRRMDDKDLDWTEMRARCKRLLDRTQKAADRLPTDAPDATVEPPQANNGEGHDQLGRALSPRQMQVQQQILKRRAGL